MNEINDQPEIPDFLLNAGSVQEANQLWAIESGEMFEDLVNER